MMTTMQLRVSPPTSSRSCRSSPNLPVTPVRVTRGISNARRGRQGLRSSVVLRAQDDDSKPKETAKDVEDAESRLEALEATARNRAPRSDPSVAPSSTSSSSMSESSWSEWKEGELFPENWDKMNLFERAGELYMGQRGLLFWLNKVAFGSVFVLIFLWILFRFVGPQLGLYDLRSSLTDIQF
ncbi:hypothetical protein BSKO_10428 [Bryopsis sp. KO-2023]|nr:hypothetical protein BSKO_10428 [Bryopsis sp. KO-2023]